MIRIGKTLMRGTIISAAVVAISNLSSLPLRASDPDPNKTGQAKPVQVIVTKPQRRSLTRDLRMPATLMAYQSAALFAKTSGYIESIAVDIGDRVQQGDTLLVISVPEMLDEMQHAEAMVQARRTAVSARKAKVDQAESLIETARAEVQRHQAELQLRQITMQRKQALRDGNAIPQQELDNARGKLAVAEAQLLFAKATVGSAIADKRSSQADVEVAEAQVAVARADLGRLRTLMDYATIRAPFDGIITERHVDPGAFVRSAADGMTTPMLYLSMVQRIRLVLEIPESDASFVQIGTAVQIVVSAIGGDPMDATVTRTAGALKTETRTMRAEVDLENSDGRLAPGMYAQVTVHLQTTANALMIPSKAIRVLGRKTSVLVAGNNVARSIPVTIGYDDGIWAEIQKGLDGDELVIISAGGSVAPGSPVSAVLSDS